MWGYDDDDDDDDYVSFSYSILPWMDGQINEEKTAMLTENMRRIFQFSFCFV